jgi:hypothetical protein
LKARNIRVSLKTLRSLSKKKYKGIISFLSKRYNPLEDKKYFIDGEKWNK